MEIKKMKMRNETMEAKEILKSLAEAMGLNVVPKIKEQPKIVNVANCPDDAEGLIEEIKKLNQQITLEREFNKQAKGAIIDQWNKEGPNEFSKLVFDTGKVVPNRIVLVNSKETEKEKLVSALEEKLKTLLVQSLINRLDKKIASRIKSIIPIEQSFGTGLKVTI